MNENLFSFVLITVCLYCMLYFIDGFLKSCLNFPYITFLEKTGISVSFFHLKWTTTVMNRPLLKWSSIRSRLLHTWFHSGMIVTVLLIIPSLLLILYNCVMGFKGLLRRNDDDHVNEMTLSPMIPGINLPLDDFFFYFISFLISSLLHELGHAIAAVREDVKLLGIGCSIFLLVPTAFVNLSSDCMKQITFIQRLRILSAGVWHNIVLSIIAIFALYFAPYLLSMLYFRGIGVIVLKLTHDSPLLGARGLSSGDLIDSIGLCPVVTKADWSSCLLQIIRDSDVTGHCFRQDVVSMFDETVENVYFSEGTTSCCHNNTTSHLCFELLDKEGEPEIKAPPFSCLPARTMLKEAIGLCNATIKCPQESHCYKPSLPLHSKLITIQVRKKIDVVFVGYPGDILSTVSVSEYIPRFNWVPLRVAPDLEKLLLYFILFSSALVVINITPCYGFDGQWIFVNLLQIVPFLKRRPDILQGIIIITTFTSTMLVAVNVLLGVLYLVI